MWYWRLLLGLPVLPAAVQMLIFSKVIAIDPPSLLVTQGRIKEARDLLYQIYGEKPPSVADKSPKVSRLELQIKEMSEAAAEAKAIPRIYIYQAICDPFLRCALLLGMGLAAFQQLCGINALMSYSNSLFSEAGIPPAQLTLASTAMAAANVFVSCLTSRVVDNWGRRKLLLVGSFLQTLAMLVMTQSAAFVPPNWSGVVAVCAFTLFVVSFSAGLGAITWLYLSEIYPMEIRGSALSTCGVINWLSCFAVVFGARFLTLDSACRLFGMISFVGLVGVYLWVVETKGTSMDDSPLTPRSQRSSSTLLTPSSPKEKAAENEDEDEEEEDIVAASAVRAR